MRTTAHKIIVVTGREQLSGYALLVVVMVLAASLEAIGIGAVLPFLGAISQPEVVLANDHVRRVFALLGQSPDSLTLVLVAGAAMIFAIIAKNLLMFVATWLQGHILFRERAVISRRLFAHYLALPYGLHLKKNMASLIHAVSGVATSFATVYMASLLMIAAELLVCAAIAVLLLIANPTMTLLAAVFTLGIGVLYATITRGHAARLGVEQNRLAVALNKCLIEGLSALKETRIFGAAPHFLRRYDLLAREYTRASVHMHVLAQAPRLAVESLFIIAIVGAVMYLAATGRDLKAIIPTFVLFGMAFLRILPSYNRILTSLTSARINKSALNILHDELIETLAQPGALPSPAPSGNSFSFEHELRLAGIAYAYPGESKRALDRIDLTVRKGEIVGLVGKSGAGKTTLVDLILGLLEAEEGDVLVDGESVTGRHGVWRKLVGYIPQTIYLMDDTLRHNIAFGIDDDAIDEAALQRAIAAAQLEDFVRNLPGGLETIVGDRGVRLSGGQRQRVGIARALYRDPPILVLDEATSALDVETESAVTEAIHALGHSKTLIIIAHRLTTVKDCDRLYLIENGSVADSGTYTELNERNPWFKHINEVLS